MLKKMTHHTCRKNFVKVTTSILSNPEGHICNRNIVIGFTQVITLLSFTHTLPTVALTLAFCVMLVGITLDKHVSDKTDFLCKNITCRVNSYAMEPVGASIYDHTLLLPLLYSPTPMISLLLHLLFLCLRLL